jgi:GntR family transcriptional repressor for pyruvate dehydrogenase complex
MMLEKLESKRKSLHVVEQILGGITTGLFVVGAKLPSEQDMSARTGVSRVSVREALGVLRLLQVLETRPGNGTYVKRAPVAKDVAGLKQEIAQLLGQAENPFEALEARRVLEAGLTRLAIDRLTVAAIAEIREALEAQEAASERGDYDRLMTSNRAFHLAIAGAANNSMLERALVTLIDALDKGVWRTLKREKLLGNEARLAKSKASHRAIFEAICARDPGLAVRLLDEHFDVVEELLEP